LSDEGIRQMILERINSLIGDVPVEGGADSTETVIQAKITEPEVLSPAA
jgi:hypothetical protein